MTEILGESLDDLRATRTSLKWQAVDPDVLPAWVAEMDARPCPPVVEAVSAALRRGDTGYRWDPPLQDAFAAFAKRRWDWAPEPGMVVADVMSGIAELLHVLTPADGAVVLSPPCYNSFFEFVESVHRRAVLAPLDAGFRLDAGTLERAFVEAGPGSAYILCNPQNPTGTVHTADELATLARLAAEHDVTVISDEIHAPLVQPGVTFTPYLAVPEAAAGITVASGSKTWNLAGLKTALVVPGPDGHDSVGRLHEAVTHGANHLAVIAQTVAYEHGEGWLDQLLAELGERRRLLVDLLAEHLPQVRVAPWQATYLAWLNCRGLGLDDPAAAFLDRGRVAVSAGTLYDPAGAGRVRFNFGTSAQVVTEAVRRMAASV